MKSTKLEAAVLLLVCVVNLSVISHAGGHEQSLHVFPGAGAKYPSSTLLFDDAGNLYGTTQSGGTYINGTVFELSPVAGGGWSYTTLHIFKGAQDGANPGAGLVVDGAGNLYGTTYNGGSYNLGAAFELTPGAGGVWTESVIYSFGSVNDGNDGYHPQASLIMDGAGNLYGTTEYGGAAGASGFGTVFELSPSGGGWTESVLYSFGNGNDGAAPLAPLIFDYSGNLYGTTAGGGAFSNGTVFELSPSISGVWTESLLHTFQGVGSFDGILPSAGLIFDSTGNLYSTTQEGGPGGGTVFMLAPHSDGSWSEKIIHGFKLKDGDGFHPLGSVAFDPQGNIYGTTVGGGVGYGTAFRLTLQSTGNWVESGRYDFTGSRDGANPFAGLVIDALGNLYGTTYYGGSGLGSAGDGVVFEIRP